MIKPEELRIGNYVMAKDQNNVWFNWQIGNYEELNPDIIKHRKPLPLTEIWLREFGFEYEDLGDDSPYERHKSPHDEYFTIWEFNGEYWLIDYTDNELPPEVTSIHQLQNIHYFITGKELTIKS